MATSINGSDGCLQQWTFTDADRLYDPLQFADASECIRLLEIQPCPEPSATIHCTLRTVRLSDEPPYAALSYVWGDPTAPRTAYINDLRIDREEKLQAMPPIQATNVQEVSLALRDLPEIPTVLYMIL